jgi:capsular polysaccharide biosynthesis protein
MRNRDELMAAISQLGFEKYVLEDLTPEEQIELFYDADVVVGTHGAGLTNLLFSPHTRVLELFPRDFVEPHYLFMCKSLGHMYRFWLNTACSRLELEYLTLRIRQRMERSTLSNGSRSRQNGRTINLSYSVDVREVTSILAEMGVR